MERANFHYQESASVLAKLILFNKPYDVLCQFTDADGRPNLSHYLSSPNCSGCYAAGRLDRDSEGLLLLTDDGRLQQQIAHPRFKLPKTYWVQVEGDVTEAALTQLRQGVQLKDGPTRPAKVKPIATPELWPRTPDIRYRANIPTSWLEVTISEGRNRQVRRMTAAVDLPTLRLVRVQIGNWQIGHIAPGDYVVNEVHPPKRSPLPRRRKTR